jgi:hypothetical protein
MAQRAHQQQPPLAPDNVSNDFDRSTGWYSNCIGVGAHNSNIVGIGRANGPWLSSEASDVMSRWELAYEQSNSSHVHGNIPCHPLRPRAAVRQDSLGRLRRRLTYSYAAPVRSPITARISATFSSI